MKRFLSLSVAAIAVLGLSSCCCMFSGGSKREYRQVQKRTCGYDIVTETVVTDSKSGMTETIERKVPRYKMVNKRQRTSCLHYYCPDTECCGTTGPKTRAMASVQGHSGSPNLGLIPTMRPLAD